MKGIHFFRADSGASPVEKFLDSLPSAQPQKVAWVLQLLEDLDVAPVQYFKKRVNTYDIWEVRLQVGGDTFSILGFLDGNHVVVLNHAF